MAVSAEISRLHVDREVSRAAEAARGRFKLNVDRDNLNVSATVTAKDGEEFIFEFIFDDYRERPPIVNVLHPQTEEKNGKTCMADGCKNYFHPNNILCAPWNRLAYSVHGGPHKDWTMTNWESIHPEHQELGTILDLLWHLLNGPEYVGRRK